MIPEAFLEPAPGRLLHRDAPADRSAQWSLVVQNYLRWDACRVRLDALQGWLTRPQ